MRFEGINYFSELSRQPSFNEIYVKLWKEPGTTIRDGAIRSLNDLDKTLGAELDQSWELDRVRWGIEVDSFETQKSNAIEWLEHRKEWMDEQLSME